MFNHIYISAVHIRTVGFNENNHSLVFKIGKFKVFIPYFPRPSQALKLIIKSNVKRGKNTRNTLSN